MQSPPSKKRRARLRSPGPTTVMITDGWHLANVRQQMSCDWPWLAQLVMPRVRDVGWGPWKTEAHSSTVEHQPLTLGVDGSNPSAPAMATMQGA